MTNIERYQAALKACAEAVRIVCQHDIQGFLDAIERADAVGPILDPTLYRDKAEAMEQDRELFRAAMPLVRYRAQFLRWMAEKGERDL